MKGIALLSGGLDSTIALILALENNIDVLLCITFDYGQIAFKRELASSGQISGHYGIPHHVIKLDLTPPIGRPLKAGILKDSQGPPELKKEDLKDNTVMQKTAENVWVPNRNGMFINIASYFTELYNCDYIITGINKEEGETFPDNTKEFLEAVNSSLKFTKGKKVSVISPTQNFDKREIVKQGIILNAPFSLIWSCYLGGESHCMKCESCRRFSNALEQNALNPIEVMR